MGAKKKLLVLNDYDFFLFGISCPEKSYRLCFALNNTLPAAFAKSKDIEVQEKNKKEHSRFSVFSFYHEEMFTDYRVIVNRVENKYLIPEFKQADYFLMIQGGMPVAEKAAILKKVKEVGFIQTAFEIDANKIKSKENLIF